MDIQRHIVALLVVGAVVPVVHPAAHHSLAATYKEDTSVTIEGELVQFVYRNPHSFMQVVVKDRRTEIRYAVEWGGAGELGAQGVTRETLKAGDFIIITGSPGRSPTDNRIRMTALQRPRDGFIWEQRPREPFD